MRASGRDDAIDGDRVPGDADTHEPRTHEVLVDPRMQPHGDRARRPIAPRDVTDADASHLDGTSGERDRADCDGGFGDDLLRDGAVGA